MIPFFVIVFLVKFVAQLLRMRMRSRVTPSWSTWRHIYAVHPIQQSNQK